jgi:PAS domain S-box-containing protein
VFVLVLLVVAVGTVAGTVYTQWRLRTAALDRHFDAAGMYARALEDHLTQSLNVIDLTLVNALSNVGDEARAGASLSAAMRHAPYLRSLALLDARGEIVASSDPRNIGVRIARSDFLPATPEPRAILRAGPPWVGRDFHDGRAVTAGESAGPEALGLIPVLRDVMRDDRLWITLLASVNSDYFLNHFERSVAAEAGVVELLRYDGVLLLATDEKQKPGIFMGDDSILGRIAQEEIGRFEQRLGDGRAVLTAYRASRAFPFVIVVHLDKQNGLAGWRQEAGRTLAVVFAVLVAGMSLAALYFLRLERAERQHDVDERQLRLRSAALEAAANAMIITDRQGTIEWANPAFCALSGYRLEETLGRNPRELIKSGAQTPQGYRELWRTILAGDVWRGELINRRKDGADYLEAQTITPVKDDDGTVHHFIAVKQDISEHRQAELRMEELSRHLVVVQESERRRLSGELHDRTSPNLAAIGVNLDIVAASVLEGNCANVSARLDDVRALIEDTTASIREVCSDLRPPVLDYAGLFAALESYAKQFQRRTNMAVRIDCPSPNLRLAPALESVLFRIAQEALTNCAKHSRARSILLSLRMDSRPVVLTIGDDGIGFDPDSLGKTTHASGLGVLTMREMAEFSGGRFTLASTPGGGTRISVEIDAVEEPA